MMVKSNSGIACGPSSAMAAFTARSRLSQDFCGSGAALVGRFLMLALVLAIIGGSPSLAVGLRPDRLVTPPARRASGYRHQQFLGSVDCRRTAGRAFVIPRIWLDAFGFGATDQ